MQKNIATKSKIIEKMSLKNKLLMKSSIQDKNQLMVVRFAYEDTMAACGYSNGLISIYNLSTDNKICQINTNNGKQFTPVTSIRWKPHKQNSMIISSTLLAANANGNLYEYVAKTGKQLFHTKEQDNFIMGLDYSMDGIYFATVGKDNIPKIYDQQTKKIIIELKGVTWQLSGHNNRLFAVKFKNDQNNIVATGGWDQNINLWDIRIGNSISTLYGPKITGDSIDIRNDLVLTGANRGSDQLQIWDWRNNKTIYTYRWDIDKKQTNAFLYGCQFCHNSKNTVLAIGGSQLKIFTLDDYNQMLQVKFHDNLFLYSCDSSYTGNKYITGGNLGTLFYMGSNKTLQ